MGYQDKPTGTESELRAAGSTDARVEEDLFAYLDKLASELGQFHHHEVGTASAAKLLGSSVCERRISFELKNPSELQAKFDSIYREKSEYATLKILDHLKRRLQDEGYDAALATEVKDDVGIYDVTIVHGSPSEILRKDELVARVEVKASLGLPLEQIERYLWRPSPLILVRVIPGHVALLRPSELQDFVHFSKVSALSKASRIMEGKGYVVPGRYCRSCRDFGCEFNRSQQNRASEMIQMDDEEFGMDLLAFLGNISYVAERTAEFVVRELKTRAIPVEKRC